MYKVSSLLAVTHMLFVDDVIFFGIGSLCEWQAYNDSLKLFYSASGMCISMGNSSFLFNETNDETREGIKYFLPYKMEHIDEGFKYLGYHLKPTSYGIKDWR